MSTVDRQIEPGAPRVARIITRMNIGGPARHALILTRRMKRYECDLIAGATTKREGDLTADDLGEHMIAIPTLQRELSPWKDLRTLLTLRRYMAIQKPDVVHTHMAKAGTLGRISARWAKVPIVIHTYHGHVLDGYFSRRTTAFYTRIERWLARRTDVLIAISPEIRDQLLALGIGTKDQWRVVSLGLELDQLLDSTMDPSTARARLGLEDKTTIGIVGRLVPIKDHATFLEACRILVRDLDVNFVVAGDGELRRSLEAAASDLGTSVRFVGWVQDLESLYSALDVVVLTSRNEGTPVALIEAMAAGRPIVATDVGGVADCVPPLAGRLVPAGDAAAVAEAVKQQLADPSPNQASRDWVRSRYGADRLVSEIEDLYGELLAKGAATERTPA